MVTIEDAKEILAAGDVFSNFERRLALAVVGQAERVAEYENAANWGTSCLSCSRVLDSSIRDHERAEEAEEAVATLTRYADSLGELNDEMAGNYAEALTRAETAERERDEWKAKATSRVSAAVTRNWMLRAQQAERERDDWHERASSESQRADEASERAGQAERERDEAWAKVAEYEWLHQADEATRRHAFLLLELKAARAALAERGAAE